MKALDANQKDQPTEMNYQQNKQPWKQKDCNIHQQLWQWSTIKECRSKETKRQREKADTDKAKSREWIYQWEWKWWINTNTEKE